MYYVDRRTLMALPVSTGPELALGQPQKLFESADLLPESPSYAWPLYDASADGQRFLMVTPVADGTAVPPKIRIVENWYEEFRDREQ